MRLRKVLRLMPRICAARIWLPRVFFRVSSIKGRSILSITKRVEIVDVDALGAAKIIF